MTSTVDVRVPINPALLTGPLTDLGRVHLAGTRCGNCNEVSLGARTLCPNCGSEGGETLSLSRRGVLWTFTVVRHRPPGDYRGPEPFVPFGLGLVELPDGVRVMSPIDCDVNRLKIGLELELKPYVRTDNDGREVVAFSFAPAEEGGAAA